VGQAADELRTDIERTREDLGSTMDAIGDRISPRLQAQRQADRLRQSGIEPKLLAMAAAALCFGFMLLRRRRRSGPEG
jgi:Protein of unknown function (DUF3618)